MSDAILWLLLILAAGNAVLLVVLLGRSGRGGRDRPDALRDELRVAREEAGRAALASREELAKGLTSANATLALTLKSMGDVQRAQLDGLSRSLKELSESNQASLDRIRITFDSRVKELQDGNEKKLEEMRKTVDEKLHDTLEKRLGESFKLVSDRLEAVQRGLGEMQNLATGVGDLKRVLTNVKTRGTWAEVQLGALLEQILAPGQFERNVHVKADSREMVEFAVRLPGPKDEPDACVWLPIDSKFPQEDYLRLQDAAERGDCEATQSATDALARAIRLAAQDIHDKYVSPPHTTDFAIMFLATEGLYAEVLRQPALVDELQHRLPRRRRRADHAGGASQQPAHGLPDAGHRAAGRRGLAGAGRGQDRVRQVRRRCSTRSRASSTRPAAPSSRPACAPAPWSASCAPSSSCRTTRRRRSSSWRAATGTRRSCRTTSRRPSARTRIPCCKHPAETQLYASKADHVRAYSEAAPAARQAALPAARRRVASSQGRRSR